MSESESYSRELRAFDTGSKRRVFKVMTAHTKANIKKRVQEAEVVWTLDGTTGKQAIVVGNIFPSGHEAGNVYDPKGIAPTLKCNGPPKA